MMEIASQHHIDRAEALLVMMKAEWPEALKINNTPEQRRVLASYLLNREFWTMQAYYGLPFMEALLVMLERRECYDMCAGIRDTLQEVQALCNNTAPING